MKEWGKQEVYLASWSCGGRLGYWTTSLTCLRVHLNKLGSTVLTKLFRRLLRGFYQFSRDPCTLQDHFTSLILVDAQKHLVGETAARRNVTLELSLGAMVLREPLPYYIVVGEYVCAHPPNLPSEPRTASAFSQQIQKPWVESKLHHLGAV